MEEAKFLHIPLFFRPFFDMQKFRAYAERDKFDKITAEK